MDLCMINKTASLGSFLGGMFLVAGTAIGGGMLALPVLTGLAGFIPSLVLYLLCWLFMASTGLLYLEACLWSEKETNFLSLATRTLGKAGRYFTWVVYLFFFYCLTLAYIVGCGDLFSELSGGYLSSAIGSWLFVLLFAPFVFLGTKAVAPINIMLMVGLGLSYFTFIALGFHHVDNSLLLNREWSHMFIALPVAFAAFGYQGIVPTLVHHMERDAPRIRLAILLGSLLPLVAYVIWNWLILGIVPVEGADGLQAAMALGKNAVHPLKGVLNTPFLYIVGQFFAFFALVTSFFGVTLGLLDFLADGLKIEKNIKGRLFLSTLIFLPPLVIASYYPGLFLVALTYAGGFGSVILLGLLPILIVWVGRYRNNLAGEYQFFGGKPLLAILAIFVLLELASELFHLL